MEKYLALTGGVGGAKLALGLTRVLPPDSLAFIVNTGDDFEHLGLHVSPDLDTLMYTLAELDNRETGWGRTDESWRFIETFAALGGESWFNLGDRDLAVHIRRTEILRQQATLSAATAILYAAHGIAYRAWPMSDQRVPTRVDTDSGNLAFQHYFVRDRCRPVVREILFEGAPTAPAIPAALDYLADPDLAGIIICPSNPFLSIDPILAIPELRAALAACAAPIIAVSPLVDGQAVKGPTAKIMKELGLADDASAIADHYGELIHGFVLDQTDAVHVAKISQPGRRVVTAQTLMRTLDDRINLAHTAIEFLHTLQ